jgi:hypothetical protein
LSESPVCSFSDHCQWREIPFTGKLTARSFENIAKPVSLG